MFQNEAVCLDSVFETPLNKSQIEVSERNKERKNNKTRNLQSGVPEIVSKRFMDFVICQLLAGSVVFDQDSLSPTTPSFYITSLLNYYFMSLLLLSPLFFPTFFMLEVVNSNAKPPQVPAMYS